MTMNDDTTGAREAEVSPRAGLNRRAVMAAAAAGLATAGASTGFLRLASAQDDAATPAAEATDATPATSTSPESDTSRVSTIIERARAEIAAVEADREAVADQIEAATVDEVLSQASLLVDEAQAGLDGGDPDAAMRLAAGSWRTAEAGRDLIVAQVSYAGLPSQQAAASRVLAQAYERIDTVATATATADVGFYVTTAQAVYQVAYEQYAASAWAQALANGKAISGLLEAASILAGSGGAGRDGAGAGTFGEGGIDRNSRGRGMQAPMDGQPGPDDEEPETVPAPDF